MAEPSDAPRTAAPARVRPPRLARALVALLLAVLIAAMAVLALLAWALRSEAGTAWLLGRLPGVEANGVKGCLWGDFDAAHLRIALPGGREKHDAIAVSGMAWRGMAIEVGSAGQWLHVTLAELRAERIDVQIAPDPKAAPLRAPADLALPLELEVQSLAVGTVNATPLGAEPLRDLHAQLHLGAGGGTAHRIDGLRLVRDKLAATGQAQVAALAPFALDASLQLRQAGEDAAAWNAEATLTGTLAAPTLQATLRAQPIAGRPAQAFDARVALKPFAAWPLGELQATARALDLSAFANAAPATALDLDASATSSGAADAASLSLHLVNRAPGRWNDGQLPLRDLTLALRGRPADTSTLDLPSFEATLGNRDAEAGHISGSGRWTRTRWNLDMLLAEVQPALLDARAPAMRVAGPLKIAGSDLAAADSLAIDLASQLDGRWTGPGPKRAVQLALDAKITPLGIDLRQARASSGSTRAELSGALQRSDRNAPWQLNAKAVLADFNPALWWPGRDGSAWRAGPHRLNAQAEIGLRLPADPGALAPLALLAALRGDGQVRLADSVLAGVPLQGTLLWRSDGAGKPTLDLDAAGNRLHADGRIDIDARGAGDRWDVQLDAPALDRLAPLARLMQAAPGSADLAGSITLSAHATGRWPTLTTDGELDARALRWDAWRAQRAEARWQAGTRADAPIDAALRITDAAMQRGSVAGPSVQSLVARLNGSGRAHSLDLQAESKALPPAWTAALQAATAQPSTAASAPAAAAPPAAGASMPTPAAGAGPGAEHTLASLKLQGALFDAPASTFAGWRGSLQTADVHSSKPGAAPLLSVRDVGIEMQWSGTTQLEVQPGKARLLGAALSWSRIAWQAADANGAARIDADVALEPFPIAPVLARLQPDFGWGGDLAVSGHLKLHSAPAFSADVVLERSRGDLTVTDETGSTTLGLTDLRIGLAAADGVWNFTQALAGRTLGVAAGAVVVRTSPQAIWPAPDAPVQGVLDVQVANLGTWGNWVPAGWRVDGTMRATASIAGRFGAPEYTGRVVGSNLGVRNFVQGVNVSGGTLQVALQGGSARIERFDAKAGNGTVKLEGEASFGEAPKADLQLSADAFELLGRIDRRIVTSGRARLQLDRDRIALDGRFGVDEGLIDFTRSDAPALGDDVVLTRGKATPTDAPPPASVAAPASRKVAIDLHVDLGEKLRVHGRGLDTGLRGDLHITAPEGRMAVDGTVRAVGGTYAAYGQKLEIDRGLIVFNGSTDNPRLDIEATRPNTDVRVGVVVSGTTLNPRVRLFSEPDLSDVDKLSWLVMGRASDGLGRTDTALLQRAALALLSGDKPSATDQLTKAIGLDEVSLRQSDGEVKETVISLGKQLSRRWYVGYERGLNATGGSWQLIYRIAQRFTLRAQSGADNSLDVIWSWRWQ